LFVLTLGQSLLPLLIVLLSGSQLLPTFALLPTHEGHDDAAKEPHGSADSAPYYGSFRILAVVTLSATIVLAAYSVPTTSALGISSTIFTATGLVLLERTARGTEDENTQGVHGAVSADGARISPDGLSREHQLAVLRDVAATLTAACGLASLFLESSTNSAIPSHATNKSYDRGWKTVHESMMLQRIFWMVPVNVLTNAFMYMIVSFFIFNARTITLTFSSFFSTVLCILLL
jgi:hypothetical protein